LTAASPTTRHDRTSALGPALVLLSAAGFGAMAIFGKLAYDAGVGLLTVLFVRFLLGGLILGTLVGSRPSLRARQAGRRAVLIGLALGAIGYATQSGLFFGALERMDASLLALLLYTYPAWVTLAAFALGRERPTQRRLIALALSSAGLVIVLAGASSGEFDTLGAIMGIAAALAYTAYILIADRIGAVMPPLELSAFVCVGATFTFAVIGAASGGLEFGFGTDGWVALVGVAVVSTAMPIAAFFAGLARVGPSTASILSTFEPVVTVTLAYLAFGERLSLVQLGGAALVLAAAVMLAAPSRAPETAPPT
jgi:drug/metabolite transporter (DMT)-like permease